MEQQLIEAIQSRAWWPVVGFVATLLVAAFRKVAPDVWSAIDTRWKPLAALVVVLVASVSDAFASGNTWQVALVMVALQVATAWPTAIGVADTVLRLSGTKAPSLDSLERDAKAAQNMISKLPPVALVLLVLTSFAGCAFLRATTPEVAGAAASNAALACEELRGSDRATCLVVAGLLAENAESIKALVGDAVEGQSCPVPSGSAGATP